MADTRMTKGEREELARLIKKRTRVTKSHVERRQAELLADAEQQIATRFRIDDEAWKELTDTAKQVVRDADEEIARRCGELGIPREFRPSLGLNWYGRGENASKERRTELYRVARTRAEAAAKAAVVQIETRELEDLTRIATGALESAEAKRFLESLPAIETLMPRIELSALGPLALSAGSEEDEDEE